MKMELSSFEYEHVNLLIRYLLAHLLADFVFQSKTMTEGKNWFGKWMLFHIIIVFLLTVILTGQILLPLIIACCHYLIDGTKLSLEKKKVWTAGIRFVADQVLHLFTIVIVWAVSCGITEYIFNLILVSVKYNDFILITLSYVWIIWPVGFLIGFGLKQFSMFRSPVIDSEESDNERIRNGGKLIGIFERIIILTFVLINQYEAIGFLITGKGLMRFVGRKEELRSEYVLAGTMMSYAFSIATGIIINLLLHT